MPYPLVAHFTPLFAGVCAEIDTFEPACNTEHLKRTEEHDGKSPVILCALLVGCLLLPLGQSLFPYLNIPVLPFDVMLERAAVPATGAEPHVRSAAARNARRLVSYEVVGKGGAVIRDDRRAVVAYAELHADRGECLAEGRKVCARYVSEIAAQGILNFWPLN